MDLTGKCFMIRYTHFLRVTTLKNMFIVNNSTANYAVTDFASELQAQIRNATNYLHTNMLSCSCNVDINNITSSITFSSLKSQILAH